MNTAKPWRTYEELSRVLLEKCSDAFGFELQAVDGTQKLAGKSGTHWAIDAKGIRQGDGAVIVVECKRYPGSTVDQGTMGTLAFIISDVDAAGGILVTPIGAQMGARLVAEAHNIKVVRLDANTDATAYIMEFLGDIIIGPAPATMTITGHVPIVTVAPVQPELGK
ncbi:restriction endonuclease [Mycobacterium sp. UM_Kg1]|uniref:restriction endonuclease n=1 Tax=Mycobacterium sp. UM_Kg1 TaxID=1545691 RepID=UPI00061AA597|nr:restriction endonuclease [Mycobacterium sp. UM_Kg1]